MRKRPRRNRKAPKSWFEVISEIPIFGAHICGATLAPGGLETPKKLVHWVVLTAL